jgi:formylmethanofuran dehydrogenase subunit D
MKLGKLGRHHATVQSREKISGKGWRSYRYLRPWISLSAKWLADAGFDEGDRIEIHSYPGALIIVKTSAADKEAA